MWWIWTDTEKKCSFLNSFSAALDNQILRPKSNFLHYQSAISPDGGIYLTDVDRSPANKYCWPNRTNAAQEVCEKKTKNCSILAAAYQKELFSNPTTATTAWNVCLSAAPACVTHHVPASFIRRFGSKLMSSRWIFYNFSIMLIAKSINGWKRVADRYTKRVKLTAASTVQFW